MSGSLPKFVMACAFGLLLCALCGTAQAGAFKVLYRFTGGTDGALLFSGVVADTSGNLYGTAFEGGDSNCSCGTVFELTARGQLKVLHAFNDGNGSDGANPQGVPILDQKGNLYGVTTYGGIADAGTVFELAHAGEAETVLYNFTGGDDGGYPASPLLFGEHGTLFGEATSGNDARDDVNGNVFKLARNGTFSVLHSFCCAQNDGVFPYGGVITDAMGNLYGTTQGGGTCQCYSGGTVFKIAPRGKETILYNFCSLSHCSDGEVPNSPLLRDSAGNLYGTTYWGGSSDCLNGCGVAFKISPNGVETVLHIFTGGNDGSNPSAGLIADASGNFYGTTVSGGKYNQGTVFELKADGTETVLHSFCVDAGCSDGAGPVAPLIMDATGNLYGTTGFGGEGSCTWSNHSGCGTIFRLATE
jgi:uncharacterized repeat protein (TIGR03803 family)